MRAPASLALVALIVSACSADSAPTVPPATTVATQTAASDRDIAVALLVQGKWVTVDSPEGRAVLARQRAAALFELKAARSRPPLPNDPE
jgi:hypothetical protein